MAKLRKAVAYRKVKRANTRTSKYRAKSYVKGVPGSKVVMFDMGNKSKKFPVTMTLYATSEINLRHNAIEAARVAANKEMEKKLGKGNYAIKVRAVPHHIMRENPLATGAGADRFQTGMTKSFGKPIGKSARIRPGAPLFTAFFEKGGEPAAKEALRKASSKIPIRCFTEIEYAV